MSKGSRSGDQFWHDIPYYPGSTTPDGRIVGEVNKSRRQDAEYHKKSLEIQQKALEQVSRIHGGQIIVKQPEFNIDNTREVFFEAAREMCHSFQETANVTNESLRNIDGTIRSGFEQSHEDMYALRGPAFPRTNLKGIIRNKQEYYDVLSSYLNGFLSEYALDQLKEMVLIHLNDFKECASNIEANLNEAILKEEEEIEKKGKEDIKADKVIIPRINEPQKLKLALNLLRQPDAILEDPGKSADLVRVLYQYALHYNQRALMEFVRAASLILEDLRIAQKCPVSSNMVVKLANNNLLHNAARHVAMERFPEARKVASVTTMNYHLGDLVRDSSENLTHQKMHTQQFGKMIDLDVQRNDLLSTILAIGNGTNRRLETMIGQGKEIISQGKTRISQGETQIAQSDVLINQGANQIIQSENINYNLGLVINNLSNLQGEIINLEELTKHFMLLFHDHMRHFEEQMHNDLEMIASITQRGLEQLRIEATITRIAIISGFAHLGDLIDEMSGKIRRTLEEEGHQTRGTIMNEGHQNRAVMEEEGLQSRAVMENEGHQTRGTIVSESHQSRAVMENEGHQTRGTIVSEGFQNRAVMKNEGHQTRDTIVREGVLNRANIQEVSFRTQQVIVDMGMHATAAISDIAELLDARIKEGNALITRLIDIESNSLSNEERQHYLDGQECLRTASTAEDIQDAYDAFQSGTEKIRASTINHFGAGVTSEMLGKLERAGEHFRRAGQRAKENETYLAAQAFAAAARIRNQLGDIKTAIHYGQKAVSKDPSALHNQYQLAQYYTSDRQFDLAIKILKSLIGKDEHYYIAMETNPLFDTIPKAEKNMLLEHIWKNRLLTSPGRKVELLKNLLGAREVQSATEVCIDLLKFGPEQFLKHQIWNHPNFHDIQGDLANQLLKYADIEGDNLVAQYCYELLFLMHICDIKGDKLFNVFVCGLENDPNFCPENQKTTIAAIYGGIQDIAGSKAAAIWQKLKQASDKNHLWLFA